jgi:hypothetical protein
VTCSPAVTRAGGTAGLVPEELEARRGELPEVIYGAVVTSARERPCARGGGGAAGRPTSPRSAATCSPQTSPCATTSRSARPSWTCSSRPRWRRPACTVPASSGVGSAAAPSPRGSRRGARAHQRPGGGVSPSLRAVAGDHRDARGRGGSRGWWGVRRGRRAGFALTLSGACALAGCAAAGGGPVAPAPARPRAIPRLALAARQRIAADLTREALRIELTRESRGAAPRRGGPRAEHPGAPLWADVLSEIAPCPRGLPLALAPVDGATWFAHDRARTATASSSWRTATRASSRTGISAPAGQGLRGRRPARQASGEGEG